MMKAILRSLPTLLIVFLFAGGAGGDTLTLGQCIDEALARNPLLMSLGYEIEAVEAEAWAAVLPSNPGFFAEYEGVPDGSPLSRFEARKVGVAQMFDFPLAYVYRKRANDLERRMAVSERLIARNEVAARVKKSYYRVLALRRSVEVYTEIERLTLELLEKARVRVAAGESASYDTLKVRVDLADIENLLLAAERDRDAALYGLKLLLGRTKDAPVDVDGALEYTPLGLDDGRLKERAMASHPALGKALESVGRHRAEWSLAKAEYFPGIEVRWFNHTLPGRADPDAWGGSVGLSIPLWGIVKERGRVSAASSRVDAAGWLVEAEKRRILLGVEDAYSQLALAEKQVARYRESTLREVEELVRIATRSYEEGEMGYLQVAEAYRSLFRTNAGYAEALYNCLASLADLELAVGETLANE